MREVKVRVLMIDELHNLLAGSTPQRRQFLNLIRFLGNELRIPVVGVGTHEAYLAIRSDGQLENRFSPFILPVWEEGEELNSLLESFAAALPLRQPSRISTPDTARYILSRTEGTIGEIARLICGAAITAIETGEEALTPRVFTLTDYQPPSARRSAFEMEL
jgi:hypothetical protein